jgi:hypothetical protein
MNRRHLTDDRLIDLCLSGPVSPADEQHLAGCPDCEVRRTEFASLLTEMDTAATAEADTAFPADRLARQQARILARIDQNGRPGRIIAFPAGHGHDTLSARTRPMSRWVAAAAAAGLIVGLAAGHLSHDFSGIRRPAVARTAVRQQIAATTMRDVTPVMTDDEFLGQIEAAIDRGGPAALRPLDALTPRAWEVR